jgi:hypothetical protein
MAGTVSQRVAGLTTAISVTASSTAAILIDDTTHDQVNYVSLINTGSNAVAVKFGDSTVTAAVFPVSGSTTGNYVLPPLMTTPIVLACPTTPFYVRMIGSAAGPAIVYVTSVAYQS